MTFDQLVTLCQKTHSEIQARAIRSVDLFLVVRNWMFGCYIVEFEQSGQDRAAYGASLVDTLAAQLNLLGIKGVSPTRLRLYRSFYREYSGIRPTLSANRWDPSGMIRRDACNHASEPECPEPGGFKAISRWLRSAATTPPDHRPPSPRIPEGCQA